MQATFANSDQLRNATPTGVIILARKRIRLAQNFLKDSQLVAELVRHSSISGEDTVLEIGPGEGVITNELAKVARKVIAVEKDPVLARELAKRMLDKSRVHVYTSDFLNFHLDVGIYKVFSNIPFNRTADILKNILGSDRVSEAYLIVQLEAAEKYSGVPVETKISLLSKPWFTFDIVHNFHSTDFEPVPAVEVVLLHVQRRAEYLLDPNQAELYNQFIDFAFHSSKDNLSLGFKRIFTYTQWKRLSKDLGFPIKAKPSELSFQQWIALFRYFLQGVSEDKKSLMNRPIGKMPRRR